MAGRCASLCSGCPVLSELLSPREIFTLCMVLMLGAAALLFGVAGRQQTQEALVGWSQQHWREAKCLVHEAGIEYTGDCNVHLEDADYGAWPPVKKSFAVAPGYKYQRCPEVFRSSRTHCSELKPETAQADGINMPRYNLIVCHHSFLPWALVQVEGLSPSEQDQHGRNASCGYQMGLASLYHETLSSAHGSPVEGHGEQPDFSKTRLCGDFMDRGWCANGRKCKFAHGRQELRQSKEPKLDPAQANACAAQVPAESGYEQAAFKMMLAACGSFSRQTTHEGVETSSANFSRCSSESSATGEALSCDWDVRVKNTFIQVEEEDAPHDRALHRSRSLPLF
ncbi:unnamed protein product [Effrenium voratum]|uniref:C3H1-type domain-containing protein n=1 Tax=Effrenium voratum TaxID=2562239 RepID=A0AA36NDX3_9DINO|nr:unnamed protein product [Effrenium voratum]